MGFEYFVVQRDELYAQVWAHPMREVAKQYGLSDVGLAKICRKLNVPIPGRGYWARKAAGRPPPKRTLPAPLSSRKTQITVRCRTLSPAPPEMTEAEHLIALEAEPANRIVVTQDDSNSLHPIVARTERSLRGAKLGDSGLVEPRAKQYLHIRVGHESIERATLIINAEDWHSN
jgi:hypothetical protein